MPRLEAVRSFFRSLYSLIRCSEKQYETLRTFKNYLSVCLCSTSILVLQDASWNLWIGTCLPEIRHVSPRLQCLVLNCSFNHVSPAQSTIAWVSHGKGHEELDQDFLAHEPLCWVPRKSMGPRLNIQRTYLYTCTVCHNYLCAFMINM